MSSLVSEKNRCAEIEARCFRKNFPKCQISYRFYLTEESFKDKFYWLGPMSLREDKQRRHIFIASGCVALLSYLTTTSFYLFTNTPYGAIVAAYMASTLFLIICILLKFTKISSTILNHSIQGAFLIGITGFSIYTPTSYMTGVFE